MTLPRATVERFRAGEAQAFAEVVRAYTELLRRVVARYWASAFEREEAMQEIWTHVYQQRASFDVERSEELGGWLATLARRRALDLLRRSDPSAPLREDGEAVLGELEAPADGADPVELRELGEAVEAFAAKLVPVWRRFFELYFVKGLEYVDVAPAMGISRLRCKYMKKVLLVRARRNEALMAALGRAQERGEGHAR